MNKLKLKALEEPLARILSDVRESNIILWAGSGLSLAAGYPCAKTLCKRILGAAQNDNDKKTLKLYVNSLQDISNEFSQLYSRDRLIEILRDCFDKEPISEPVCHYRIRNIPQIRTIITTNYDRLFEIAFNNNITVYTGSVIENPAWWLPNLFKIHGSISDPDSIIITKRDYAGFYKKLDEIIMILIKELLVRKKSVLFVGYSLGDENILDVLVDVFGRLEAANKEFFADKEFFVVTEKLSDHKLKDLQNICNTTHITLTGEELFEHIESEISKDTVCDFVEDAITKKAWENIEKHFSPAEFSECLRSKRNFRFVSNGIKAQLVQSGYFGDDATLLKAFQMLMLTKGVGTTDGRCEGEWFRDEILPSKTSSIKMCFAFDLSSKSKPKTATEFLWSVCRINGFNYRVAEDIIYNYALEHGESYEYAQSLIKRYESSTVDIVFKDGDETKATMTLQSIFRDLANMDEQKFIEALIVNKKNFIGYSKTSYDELVRAYNELTNLIIADINMGDDATWTAKILGDNLASGKPVLISSEVIFESFLRALLVQKKGDEKKTARIVLSYILDKFPTERNIFNMLNEAKTSESTDLGHGLSRKAFVLCFFTKYILKWAKPREGHDNGTPVSFFNDFCISLDSALHRCNYGALYPAHPFDWLILKCVKALDEVDSQNDVDAMELFNEMLKLLASEQKE